MHHVALEIGPKRGPYASRLFPRQALRGVRLCSAPHALQEVGFECVPGIGHAVDNPVTVRIVRGKRQAGGVLAELAAVTAPPVAAQHVTLAHLASQLLEAERRFALRLHGAAEHPVGSGEDKERRRDSLRTQDVEDSFRRSIGKTGSSSAELVEALIGWPVVKCKDEADPGLGLPLARDKL